MNSPAIAASAGGAAVAWEQVGSTGGTQVFASRRTSAGAWTAPQQLTIAGAPAGSGAFAPHVAVATNGKALVTWTQQAPDVSQLCSSLNTAGSNWAAGKPVTTPAFRRFYAPRTGDERRGTGRARLERLPNFAGNRVCAVLQPRFRYLGQRRVAGDDQHSVRLPVDRGHGHARPRHGGVGSAAPATGSSPPAPATGGNTWLGEPQRIDSAVDGESVNPQIAIDGSGKVHATWLQVTSGVFKLWTGSMK